MEATNATKAKKTGRCTAYPTIWAAIYGCTGSGSNRYREPSGRVGGVVVGYACDVCHARRTAHSKLAGRSYQEALTKAQADAGVVNYRSARAKWIDGRPVVTHPGSVDSADWY